MPGDDNNRNFRFGFDDDASLYCWWASLEAII